MGKAKVDLKIGNRKFCATEPFKPILHKGRHTLERAHNGLGTMTEFAKLSLTWRGVFLHNLLCSYFKRPTQLVLRNFNLYCYVITL